MSHVPAMCRAPVWHGMGLVEIAVNEIGMLSIDKAEMSTQKPRQTLSRLFLQHRLQLV